MSFFVPSREPWVPDPILAAGGVGLGSIDVDPDPETVRTIVAHSKEGSGPVRIAGTGDTVDDDEMEGHANSDHRLPREEWQGAGDSDEDQGSDNGDSIDGSAGKDGEQDRIKTPTGRMKKIVTRRKGSSHSVCRSAITSHEDGQIKGGHRKKDAKSKKGARRSLRHGWRVQGWRIRCWRGHEAGEGMRRPLSEKSKINGVSELEYDGTAQGEGTRQPSSMHSKPKGDALATSLDTRRSPPVQLAVLARKRSSGSERKAEHRAAELEDTLVRAHAEARGCTRWTVTSATVDVAQHTN
ncbi:hypothetical protein CF326_g7321 [Tilletia indica]|nr:hypothetical protein CF326_g7321 [Tilletia indica]